MRIPDADRKPIGFDLVVDVISGKDAAGAFHVLDDRSGFPRNVLADMPGDRPGIRIVTTARRKPDDEANRFPLVEFICQGLAPRHEQKS